MGSSRESVTWDENVRASHLHAEHLLQHFLQILAGHGATAALAHERFAAMHAGARLVPPDNRHLAGPPQPGCASKPSLKPVMNSGRV